MDWVNSQEEIVDLIVKILRPNLAAEIEADPLGKHTVELFQAGRLSAPHALDEIAPGCVSLTGDFDILLGFGIH